MLNALSAVDFLESPPPTSRSPLRAFGTGDVVLGFQDHPLKKGHRLSIATIIERQMYEPKCLVKQRCYLGRPQQWPTNIGTFLEYPIPARM